MRVLAHLYFLKRLYFVYVFHIIYDVKIKAQRG